jgi:dTDP-glucose 4,6-dehydratase
MRLLVAGGAGFIGSHFVKKIISGELRGIRELLVVDKLTYAGGIDNFSKHELNQFEFIQADISTSESLISNIKGVDAIINFAAESHVDRSINSARQFMLSNVVGTQNLLDIGRKNSIKVFLQVSTDEVYGTIPIGKFHELSPLSPNSPYSASKAASDLIALAYQKTYGLDVRITRCSNNFGPYQYPEKIIPRFITNLLLGKELPIYGDGQNIRDWIFVGDHAQALHKVLIHGELGDLYNIGGECELSNLVLAKLILERMGYKDDKIEFVQDRLGHDLRYAVDNSKIYSKLGFKPTVDFESGLEITIEWYRSNQEWWRRRINY